MAGWLVVADEWSGHGWLVVADQALHGPGIVVAWLTEGSQGPDPVEGEGQVAQAN